jgi:hypothetical protein
VLATIPDASHRVLSLPGSAVKVKQP